MAANDIMPYQEHSQSHRRVAFDLNDSAAFRVGEPVELNASGEVIEAASALTTATDIFGIAAEDSLAVDGSTNRRSLDAADNMVTVWPGGQLFKTARFTIDGTNAGTPTQLHVGDSASLQLISDVWYLDINAAGPCRIMAVLDVNGKPMQHPQAGTGVWVVFDLVATENIGNVSLPATPA